VPVYPLAAVLGRPMEQPARRDGHIAVTGDRDHMVGWLVDRIARADHAAQLDIAPLPALVGGDAARWFEGIVRINDNDSALLLAPQRLLPHLSETSWRPAVAQAIAPYASLNQSSEPVAVVFSTSVLPPVMAHRYAISGRQITAVVQPSPAIPVPGAATHVVGVTWWRRAIVPVIDFRDPAGRDNSLHRRRLIAQCGRGHGGALVAFSIEAEVLMCRPDATHQRVADVPCPPYVTGVFDVNGVTVALIDINPMFDPPAPTPESPAAEASGLGQGDAVFPDFLIEAAAGNPEALRGPLDPPAFGV